LRKTSAVALLATATATVIGVGAPAQATLYGNHDVHGEIERTYLALGGPNGFLGLPTTNEKDAPDNVGKFNNFQNGGIFWSPASGAHEIDSQIRNRWGKLGTVLGPLGYPISNKSGTPDGKGSYNLFQRGSIYYTPTTGAHEVYGLIRDAWASQGYETGALGYPVSGEYDVPGGRRNNFQGGYIVWRPADGAIIHLR
jgi:uncharacterized protein with LGFP repeats